MKNTLGQRMKKKMGLETENERKKRIAREKKENEKSISYWENLHKKPKQEKLSDIVIPLEWMKKEFYTTAKAYFLKERRVFTVDDENKAALDVICRYFANDPTFEEVVKNGQLNKGLLIIGNCGTGKSSIFDIIQEIGRKHKIPQLWFSKTSTLEVASKFTKESKINKYQGGESVMTYYSKGKVYFDDLGSENQVNDFGIKKEIMQEILEMRYNRYKSHGTKTFCTTNLSIDELAKKYDKNSNANYKRIEDRIYHMFNILPLCGETRRF